MNLNDFKVILVHLSLLYDKLRFVVQVICLDPFAARVKLHSPYIFNKIGRH